MKCFIYTIVNTKIHCHYWCSLLYLFTFLYKEFNPASFPLLLDMLCRTSCNSEIAPSSDFPCSIFFSISFAIVFLMKTCCRQHGGQNRLHGSLGLCSATRSFNGRVHNGGKLSLFATLCVHSLQIKCSSFFMHNKHYKMVKQYYKAIFKWLKNENL